MKLQFFTGNIYTDSPTYYNLFEGKWETQGQYYPTVKMTADIHISEQEDEEGLPVVNFSIDNKMWDDPSKKDEDDYGHFLYFDISIKEAIYLNNYLNAFLKANIREQNEL